MALGRRRASCGRKDLEWILKTDAADGNNLIFIEQSVCQMTKQINVTSHTFMGQMLLPPPPHFTEGEQLA
jgi:hypothetical protein